MVTQKEIKESNRDGVNICKKMAHLKIVYKGPGSDHNHTPKNHQKRNNATQHRTYNQNHETKTAQYEKHRIITQHQGAKPLIQN